MRSRDTKDNILVREFFIRDYGNHVDRVVLGSDFWRDDSDGSWYSNRLGQCFDRSVREWRRKMIGWGSHIDVNAKQS